MRNLGILSAIGLLAGGAGVALPSCATAQPAHAWEIGPIDRGRNYSPGMPSTPTPVGRGWYFDFPYPYKAAGHVHYVTFRSGPLLGKSKIVMRYRVDAPKGVRFVPQETPQEPAMVSLYFQRRGDNWTGRGRYEHYRWFAPRATMRVIAPGEYEITASLHDPSWRSVMGKLASANPAAFRSALAETDRVGILFGSLKLRGHGVYATGPARFRLISFRMM